MAVRCWPWVQSEKDSKTKIDDQKTEDKKKCEKENSAKVKDGKRKRFPQ